MTTRTPKPPPKAKTAASAPAAERELFARPGVPKPKKKLDGRPYEPTHAERQLVLLMKVAGFTQERAARQLDWPYGIDVKTFRKHFEAEWESAEDRLHALVLWTQVKIATDPAHPKVALAGIFLLKARFGYRDHDPRQTTAEVTLPPGADGSDSPVKFTLKIGERDLSPEGDA